VIQDFRARLLRGEPLFGTLVSLPSPEIVEVLSAVGFDWLFVDAEHGPFDAHTLTAMVRAAGETPCLVRTPPRDDAAIARALDAGAAGVVVPQVHDADDAAHVTALAHYPPTGVRGIGVTRANAYGRRAREYLATANDLVSVVVQAESALALANIDAIARVPGVDAVLVGPNDLAANLGHPGRVDAPEVRDAIGLILDACRVAGRRAGIFGLTADSVHPWFGRGASLVVAGADAVLLGDAARQLRAALQG
jgi:2-keto-3-deoxy-L-rhamnonate aldolase RhmA